MTRLLYILTGAVALPAVVGGLIWLGTAYGPVVFALAALAAVGVLVGDGVYLMRRGGL